MVEKGKERIMMYFCYCVFKTKLNKKHIEILCREWKTKGENAGGNRNLEKKTEDW